jgi:uncharacterized protein (DUF2126 family)
MVMRLPRRCIPGRNFDVFPVNAHEAESRRLSRFFDIGHTGGTVSVPPEERDPDFPLTPRPADRSGVSHATAT